MELRHRLWVGSPFLLAVLAAFGFARGGGQEQQEVLVEIRDLSSRELATAGFAISSEQDVHIDAVGADHRARAWDREDSYYDRYWAGNAWILDTSTRDVVWELRRAETERERGGIERFEGTVRLPAGEYIVHYASFVSGTGWDDAGWLDWIRMRSSRDYRDYERDVYYDFHIAVSGIGRTLSEADMERAREAFNEAAIVSLIGLEDDVYDRVGFSIEQATEVEIYAIGEALDESIYDYAWLINTDTREVVWRLEDWQSEHAGGAEKNRMVRRVLTLEPGSYAAIAVTDDSHDSYGWNAAPPYDPEFWGLTIRVTNRSDRSRVETYAYRYATPRNAIVELARLNDDECVSEGFTLARRMDVRVYAVGEGSSGDMFDYGWIINSSNGRAVWEMDYYDTDHAGGAEKNRMVDEVITLDAGDYVVYFVTDGSHSYYDWNSGPPIDEDAWGITVLAADRSDLDAVEPYDPSSDPAILAQLIGIRDDESRRARFALERETVIRVYAIGEGDRSEMYDLAWIENADTRRVVWEMTYRNTERAGGARKNRLFDDSIRLPVGEYILRYESDGSHSLEGWNDDAPADPFNYGVTLFRQGP